MVVKSIIDNEHIDEVQNEIVSVEKKVIIKPKLKVKKIVKKSKKTLVEDNEV